MERYRRYRPREIRLVQRMVTRRETVYEFHSSCKSGVLMAASVRLTWLSLISAVALDQYQASLTLGDPWRMADDQGNESGQEQDLRPTNSARRVKALIEQVTGQETLILYSSMCAGTLTRAVGM